MCTQAADVATTGTNKTFVQPERDCYKNKTFIDTDN